MGIEATVGWVQCGRAFSEQVIEQIRETVAYSTEIVAQRIGIHCL